MRLRVPVLLIALVVAVATPALAIVPDDPAAATPYVRQEGQGLSPRQGPPQLRREGRWLVDPQGRVVIVHGLNLVYKRKPYVPPNGPTGFTAKEAAWSPGWVLIVRR